MSAEILPHDLHNNKLLAYVRPPGWINPTPAPRYNLVVIGAGTAGLISASAVAGLGGKVALIERNLLGGDCLNVGCVPSKMLIRTSRVYADYRNAERYGARPPDKVEPDFAFAMERMRRLRARVGQHDSAARFRELGVDVFFGDAQFSRPDAVVVDGVSLRFQKAVIATGARATKPDIPGLADVGFLTNETVFNLTQRPRRLLVLGGGPLGCELAQAFCRLGSEVTLVQHEPQFLPQEERDAAQLLAMSLGRDGVKVRLNSKVTRVEKTDKGKSIQISSDEKCDTVIVDEILAGAGRAPNVQGLNLEAAGVDYDDKKGVHVNDHLQTRNINIYAAGDVCLDTRFTHTAEASARIVVQNALFHGRKKVSELTIPWCTYTDPEIAHVGLYVRQAIEQGIGVRTFTVPMNDVDRAITDGEDEGFVKIHVRAGTDKILGATIVARHAGEMINEISLAMVANIGLKTLASVIHSYPTQAEAIKKCADAYNKTRLTPLRKRLTARWLALTR